MHTTLRLIPCLGALAAAAPAFADIAFTTGAMVEVAAPISFVGGATESSSSIIILDEGVHTLTADVFVNAFGPGSHGDDPPPYLLIPAGTVVQSYHVHFDPVGGVFATLTGAVFFEPGEFIIGVQTHTPLLYAADGVVGHPLATYPGAFDTFRAFETLPSPDSVFLPVDMGSASFSLFAELGVDNARIITMPVPGPSSLCLAAGFVTFTAVRRRRV